MKKILFISLAVVVALSIGLIGCEGEPSTYTLTISSTTLGSCTDPGEGSFTYTPGEVVDLEATPDSGNFFIEWSGDVGSVADVTDATTTITMNGDYDIVANFEGPWDYEIALDLHTTVPGPFVSLWEYVYSPWVDMVEADSGPSGGSFNFTVTFGNTPFSPEDSLIGLETGLADLGQLSGDTFKLGGMGFLPFYFPDMATAANVTQQIYATDVDNWDALGELDGVKILLASPLQLSNWFGTTNVTDVSDLSGLKVRAEGNEVATVEALGATAVEMGTGATAAALSGGLIDGCFFTYSGAMAFGIAEVSDYCTEIGVMPRVYALAMDMDVYTGLHPEARALLDSYSTTAVAVQLAQDHDDAQWGTKTFGVIPALTYHTIEYLSPSQLADWIDACDTVHTDWITYMDGLGFDGDGIYQAGVDLGCTDLRP